MNDQSKKEVPAFQERGCSQRQALRFTIILHGVSFKGL